MKTIKEQIRPDLIARAFAMARKDNTKITDENAEAYFMAALAQEAQMIGFLLNTAEGSNIAKDVSNRIAEKIYTTINS